MSRARLDVSDWAFPVEGLGPGRRLILWVRGCPLACPGCMTPELWESGPNSGFREVEELAEILAPFLAGLDGLSISGGEPTLQSAGLTALIRALRANPGLEELEVLSYSGFTVEELAERGSEVAEYLSELDLLIDGRFEQEQPNTLRWRGSDNQRLHLISKRAQRYADDVHGLMPEERPIQVQVPAPGKYRIIGIPRRGDLAAFRGALGAAGIKLRTDMPGRQGSSH